MSLALVSIHSDDFTNVYEHLSANKYQNMHLREAKTEKGKRVLRYLHAMKTERKNEIEGVISGPDIYCRYQLKFVRGQTQVNVLSEKGTSKELKRLALNFVKEISERVQFEKEENSFYPKRARGQFYLTRKNPGTKVSHPNCQQALSDRVLELDFLKLLESWNFQLLLPKKDPLY